DALDAETPEARREQKPPQVPRRLREVVVVEPGAGLEHADPVPLLGEAERRDTAAEARADHADVVGGHRRPVRRNARSPISNAFANVSYDIEPGGRSGIRCSAMPCASVYFSRPSTPCRRPSPESFMPPIGASMLPHAGW